MAKAVKRQSKKRVPRRRQPKKTWRWRWIGISVVAIFALLLVLPSILPPLTTPYIVAEGTRLGAVQRTWVPMEKIAPVMARSIVAAEDANYCLHWGFDMGAIRDALEDGGNRGASTITQQMVKNVYLWHGRSWPRKALEAILTPMVELIWSKRRILEVYLNVAEFDQGVFGVEAAARHYFGVSAAELGPVQAARLAAILPDPKGRSAKDASAFVKRRAQQIADGAATIRSDGRAECFER